MKKVFFLLAVAGMFSFAACNNNAEEVADTIVEEPVAEVVETIDTTVEAAAEEVVEAVETVVAE